MAINLITSPLATAPNVFATPVINHLNAHLLNVGSHRKIANGVVRQGSLFNVGGAMYLADSDTAITGDNTMAIAVKMTPSGNTLIPSYVSYNTPSEPLAGVTYNKDYLGWYDASNIYYERMYLPRASGFDWTYPIAGNALFVGRTDTEMHSLLVESTITGTVMVGLYGSVVGDGSVMKIEASIGGGAYTELSTTSIIGGKIKTMFVDKGDSFLFTIQGTYSGRFDGCGLYGRAPEDIY